ncbi:MAG: DUF167 domain-containing protein [Candidatus Edwardsbacteria bacterium]|nr:DUF167 domain-containing protein [Candidatus Edwardsbacteria bacterium]
MRLNLKIVPNAKQEKIVPEGDVYKVYIPAPAVDGKANAYLIKFLAKHFGVRKSAVTLVRGETSRHKVVEIAGL